LYGVGEGILLAFRYVDCRDGNMAEKMAEKKVKVYGADWCSMTTQTLAHLEETGVPFEYIDVEQDEAASQWVKDQNDGKEKKPTLDLCGTVLCTPSNRELDEALKTAGLLG